MYKILKILSISSFVLILAFASQNANARLSFDERNVYNNLMGRNSRSYDIYEYKRFDDAKLQALRLNDAKMMYNIGSMYRDGTVIRRDYRQAKEWFEKAAKQAHAPSMVELAKIYSYGKKRVGIKQDLELAGDLLKAAVASDDGKAYYEIGRMYERGVFFDKNLPQAMRLYELSAKKGYDKAYVKIFMAYQYGKGMPKNESKALNWLRVINRTSKQQEVIDYTKYLLSERYYHLADIMPPTEKKEKFLLYNLAWDNGKAEAADMIAESLAKGYGVKRNCDLAKKWYEMSISQFESVQAMERLGSMLVDADCGNYKRNYQLAHKLFIDAANLGGSYGAYMVGYMKKNGMGVKKDERDANIWFDRSNKLKAKPRPKRNKRRKFIKEEDIY